MCFVSQDCGLTKAIARALGPGFEYRVSSEFQLNDLNDLREWCDVVLLDLRLSSTGDDREPGIQMMDDWSKIPSHAPIVVLSDEENRSALLKAMDHGAYDTVANPPNIVELRLILQRAYKFHAAERELARLRVTARSDGRLHELLGTSPVMQELFALANKIAPCDVSVLITGETGTGKELLARAIHKMSGRSLRPLVAFSCANLPEALIEDELFGHEKGAFTGALMARRGRVEAADTGTMFLDEIGDLSLGLQPKLLRVLQERSFERLGSNTKTEVNIRLICATNRNLAEMVQQGKFRDDLYYRLNVVQMHLPPLRDRQDDIPLLAQHFLQDFAERFKKKARRFRSPLFARWRNTAGRETCANWKTRCSEPLFFRKARRWTFGNCLRRFAVAAKLRNSTSRMRKKYANSSAGWCCARSENVAGARPRAREHSAWHADICIG